MTVESVDLADYLAIAAEVTGMDVDTLLRVAKVGLAEQPERDQLDEMEQLATQRATASRRDEEQ